MWPLHRAQAEADHASALLSEYTESESYHPFEFRREGLRFHRRGQDEGEGQDKGQGQGADDKGGVGGEDASSDPN